MFTYMHIYIILYASIHKFVNKFYWKNSKAKSWPVSIKIFLKRRFSDISPWAAWTISFCQTVNTSTGMWSSFKWSNNSSLALES